MAPVTTLTLNPSVDRAAEADRVRPGVKVQCGPPRLEPRANVQLGFAAGAAAVMTPGSELCRAEDVARIVRDM